MQHIPGQLIRYIEGLTLSGGDHDGELFVVLPWERRFLRGAFKAPGHAALSISRGNGKSALVAAIATALVDPDGPLHGRRREAVCVAASFEQSKIIFEDVLSFLRERHDLSDRRRWRLQDSANRAILEWRKTGARVRCIGSDPANAHGMRPALALLDEPSQWEPSRRDKMLAAIRTGLGKVPGSKMIALGTRPDAPEHWFAKMLAGQGVAYTQCHAAKDRDPLFQRRTWLKANPSLDHLPSLEEELRGEAAEAKRDPAMLASFKALRLNMGTADVERQALLDAGVWESIEGETLPAGWCIWGVDLGSSAAQSAIAAYWPLTGRLECLAAFPGEPTLEERGLRDGVGRLYRDMASRGELIQIGLRVVPVGELLEEAARRFGPPAVLASDRWRQAELTEAVVTAGLPVVRPEWRGQGFKDGGEDVRAFRRACLAGQVAPVPSLLLRAAMSEATTISDPAGNAKLAKATQGGRRSRARDDAAAAAILAVAAGTRLAAIPAPAPPGRVEVIR